jgi:tetratricopeptide (TPR) repeat protein
MNTGKHWPRLSSFAWHRTAAFGLIALQVSFSVPSTAAELSTAEIAKRYVSSVMLVKCEGAQGTGFVLSADGTIVTNCHVIEGGKNMLVKSHTGGIHEVHEILAVDKDRDIALLKADAKNLQSLELADPSTVVAGSKIIVIGNPVGLESTVSEGIVSAKRSLAGYGDVLQITAPISPGSSGSPVFNEDGKVVGIATFKRIDGESLNFAIPSNHISAMLASLKEGRTPTLAKGDYQPKQGTKGSPEQDTNFATSGHFAAIKKLEAEGAFFEMLTEAKKQVQAFPESALAHRILSDAFFYTKLYEDAAASAKSAIDLAPENARGWNNLAIISNALGAEEVSKRVYAQAIKIAPNDVKLLIEYAELIGESNVQLALEALKSAYKLLLDGKGIDIESSTYPLEAMLVAQFCDAGASNLAHEASQQLLKVKPNDSNLWIANASAALQAAKYDEVRPSLSKAFQLNPACKDQPALHVIVGRLELARNNPFAAQKAFEHAYNLGSDNITTDDLPIVDGIVDAICSKDFISDDDKNSLAFYISELSQIDSVGAENLKNKVLRRLDIQR